MTRPRFSIVMNVYNGAATLDASVESVLAQGCTDWELIFWDDCSTDDSVARCAAWVARDPRMRLHRAERNAGLGASRNRAIAVSRGEWVAFLDQDDLWTPDKLAAQAALIDADTTGMLGLVYGRAERFDEQGRIGPFDSWYGHGPLPEGDIFELLLQRPSFVALSTSVYRRDVLDAIGPVPEDIRFCNDYWFSLMACRGRRVAALQTLCCHYRVHAKSMSFVYRRQVHMEALRIMHEAAGPGQARILRRRRLVHNSLIGVEEIRAGQPLAGSWRILAHGSLAYLLLRPAVAALRRLRDRRAGVMA